LRALPQSAVVLQARAAALRVAEAYARRCVVAVLADWPPAAPMTLAPRRSAGFRQRVPSVDVLHLKIPPSPAKLSPLPESC